MKENQLKITVHSDGGKMHGFKSLNTNMLLNVKCQKYSNNNMFICHDCYAEALIKYYNMNEKLTSNTEILTGHELTKKEIYSLNINDLYFRFESFGDLNNLQQLKNFCLIARTFPKTRFALWTKRLEIIKEAITSGLKKPRNLNIIFSSPRKNRRAVLSDFIIKSKWINAVFTVYTLKYLCSYWKFGFNLKKINNFKNCLLECINCLKCYKPIKGIAYINELIKSDLDCLKAMLKNPTVTYKVIYTDKKTGLKNWELVNAPIKTSSKKQRALLINYVCTRHMIIENDYKWTIKKEK